VASDSLVGMSPAQAMTSRLLAASLEAKSRCRCLGAVADGVFHAEVLEVLALSATITLT